MDIVQTILDALAERYGRLTGWHHLIGAILSIAGTLAAKELYDRHSRFRRKSLVSLTAGERLVASVVTQTDQGTKKIEAELSRLESKFVLDLLQTNENDGPLSNRQTFGSWDEVARYLEANTVLRISDFKTPANPALNTDPMRSHRAG